MISRAAVYSHDVRSLWYMTGSELALAISAGIEREKRKIADYELLAYNTAALVLAAVNAPDRFPNSPDTAFGRKINTAEQSKSDLMYIAELINRNLRKKVQ